MSSSSESAGEEQDATGPTHEEQRDHFSTDGQEGSSGGSGRITEPAPPTYEEAISLFVRGSSTGGSGGGGAVETRPSRAARGHLTGDTSGDMELAERLQREEIEQRSATMPTRERSVSSSAAAGAGGGSGGERSRAFTGPRTMDPARFSVVSAPGDFRPAHIHGQRMHPSRSRLRTIPENEVMVIDTTAHHSDADSCGKACCYYTCFGFPTFTNRLSPTLRAAWRKGVKHMAEISLPVFSVQSRYILFCVQALVTLACIVLSFAFTSFKDENVVRGVSLVACLVVNLLERIIVWCGCCRSKRKCYNTYSDITRNILTDILLYPAVIASIMNALKTQSYNVVLSLWDDTIYTNTSTNALRDDAINISMNALVVLLFIVMVYALRLGQLGKIAKSLASKFKQNVSGARTSARVFIIVFFLHVFTETVIQILYLFLIGFRIHTERSDPSQPQILGVSVYLFIMMVCGELVPLLGNFMYFITAQKWAEEFPIILLIDHTPSNRPLSDTALERVEYQFKALHAFNTKCSGCLFGLIHPMLSPFQMLLTILFFTLWVLFAFTYPIKSINSTYLDLSLGSFSSSLVDGVEIIVVYGFTVFLSFLVNLLPILYGLLGLAMLPFWGLFYCFIGCSSLCGTKS